MRSDASLKSSCDIKWENGKLRETSTVSKKFRRLYHVGQTF